MHYVAPDLPVSIYIWKQPPSCPVYQVTIVTKPWFQIFLGELEDEDFL